MKVVYRSLLVSHFIQYKALAPRRISVPFDFVALAFLDFLSYFGLKVYRINYSLPGAPSSAYDSIKRLSLQISSLNFCDLLSNPLYFRSRKARDLLFSRARLGRHGNHRHRKSRGKYPDVVLGQITLPRGTKIVQSKSCFCEV